MPARRSRRTCEDEAHPSEHRLPPPGLEVSFGPRRGRRPACRSPGRGRRSGPAPPRCRRRAGSDRAAPPPASPPRLVRHRLGHLDQGLDTAERLREREDPRRGRDADGVRMAEGDHAAEARPAHVVDAGRAGAGTRSRRARSRRGPGRAARACAARGGRGSSRTGRARRRPRSARSARARGAPRVGHDHGAADGVGVPAQVLGRRVDHGVGAQLERALDAPAWRRCCRPRPGRRATRSTTAATSTTVERRVGRRLDPDQRGVRRPTAASSASRSVWSTMCSAGPSERGPCRRGGTSRRRGRAGARRGRPPRPRR